MFKCILGQSELEGATDFTARGVKGALGEECKDVFGQNNSQDPCPKFCCGTCFFQYCCSDELKKFDGDKQKCEFTKRANELTEAKALKFPADFDDDDWNTPNFGTFIAVGVTLFVVFVATIILCFTCSCCCLYKMCRRPPPVVTTTTATTVVHSPYPQQPGVPPGYPVAAYQGYHPIPVQPGLGQPGMPVAPYPTQYPPPYPAAQPSGPPAYHETVAAGAGAPYPVSQPPYNPAYMDSQKPSY
ncbi:protein shisa-5 isoform X1 [Ornithorhynchus anatinus]|uniref:protein shisa-5 isoform X1 n=1 Tax=Ornithorhynchus anatinus TaxID=9258 RepID=UPI0010A92F53|nr:protein shisa-5 isoform X1 [Ornithorhynchus anatinus]